LFYTEHKLGTKRNVVNGINFANFRFVRQNGHPSLRCLEIEPFILKSRLFNDSLHYSVITNPSSVWRVRFTEYTRISCFKLIIHFAMKWTHVGIKFFKGMLLNFHRFYIRVCVRACAYTNLQMMKSLCIGVDVACYSNELVKDVFPKQDMTARGTREWWVELIKLSI
jgi:hypothetical protein